MQSCCHPGREAQPQWIGIFCRLLFPATTKNKYDDTNEIPADHWRGFMTRTVECSMLLSTWMYFMGFFLIYDLLRTYQTDQTWGPNCLNSFNCDFLFCRHSQRHEETEKKYKCNQCEFATRIPGHLKRHLLVHSGGKPFQCPHCEYSCNNIVSVFLKKRKFPPYITN